MAGRVVVMVQALCCATAQCLIEGSVQVVGAQRMRVE